jgi:hypothetical protein
MSKFTASTIQRLLGVNDGTVIAYGYTPARHTLVIWFEGKKIWRRESYGPEVIATDSSLTFECGYFHSNVKRWYIGDRNGTGLHERLADLFETFGHPLSTVEGGKYPPTIAIVKEGDSP